MARTYDVIVVGIGGMGSATCYHLARRGVSVLGLEQFDIPHGLGSSHGYSRMIRLAYFNHPGYVPLLRQAYLLWQHLENDYGHKILHLTTGLYMGPPGSRAVEGALQACIEHNIGHDRLTQPEIARQYPQFNLPEHFIGLRDHSAGLVLPERANCAHSELALHAGATLHGREPVLSWTSDGKSATVRTTRDTYHASRIVFTGGAWTGNLLKNLGVKLVVTRQMLCWTWPSKPAEFRIGHLPVWVLERAGDDNFHYGFPMMSDNPGFKFAYDRRGLPIDPDRLQRDPTAEDESHLRPFLKQYIPAADGPILSMRACMYTNTPDFQFILDTHPAYANISIACGFSGHGFKFTPVIGQVMADLALQGKSSLPIDFLSVKRFLGPAAAR